ncbi:phosphoadenosine phosphosulfate reductase [Nonomuraea sp. NPDC000554]|uniref:phosphoadenosine phosphosulfate reductase n=1 Tax=Nonomuraea sp. NPDC000554 TaxID=3154259 RepID=UPI00331F1BED
MSLSVFSFGGGRQSVAALVLAAQGKLPVHFDHWVFSNVGDDSEHPGTIAYFHNVVLPFADKHHLDVRMIRKVGRDGEVKTLYGQLTREGSRSIEIPVRMEGSAAPGNRSCTGTFKIDEIAKWLKQNGATADNPATVGVGISLDEIERINSRKAAPYEKLVYPLVDMRLRVSDCIRTIRDAGLPIPPKSSCWFCPLHTPENWADLRRDEPDLFEAAAGLEDTLNERRAKLGKDRIYLTRYGATHGQSLRQVIPAGRELLPFLNDEQDASCDNGWCMT